MTIHVSKIDLLTGAVLSTKSFDTITFEPKYGQLIVSDFT